MADLAKTIREVFPQRTVVIVGDLVADQFLRGTISRVSREAPVFIMRHEETDTRPGGAANAAANVASLGGTPVVIGVVGEDTNGDKLVETMSAAKVDCSRIVRNGAFSTTTKVRVLAGQQYAARQQVIRIDYENTAELESSAQVELRSNFAEAATSADAIIMSDYNYGVVFDAIYQDALAISKDRGVPLIVDSRYALSKFSGATTATPNREEAEQILGKDLNTGDCSNLREQLGYKALLITDGNKGMTLYEDGHPPRGLPAIGPSEPVDVTGAGDTVIAAYALGLASGLSFADAAAVANHAGGLVVMKKGTATADAAELIKSLNSAAPLASTHDA